MKKVFNLIVFTSFCFGQNGEIVLNSSLDFPNPVPKIDEAADGFKKSEFVSYKSPALAGSLSLLWPGLGQVYLEDYRKAAILASEGIALFRGQVGFQWLWFYSPYSAYRDARVRNGLSSSRYRMPTETFSDLLKAPFEWKVIQKKEVWAGYLGAMACAVGITQLYKLKGARASSSKDLTIAPLMAIPVAISEESFFRGFVQSGFLEVMPSWAAISLSSVLFGAAHLGNAYGHDGKFNRDYAMISIPYITLFGGYFGYVAYKNHSLKEGVALHMWYDFTLFALSAAQQYSAALKGEERGKPIGISFQF